MTTTHNQAMESKIVADLGKLGYSARSASHLHLVSESQIRSFEGASVQLLTQSARIANIIFLIHLKVGSDVRIKDVSIIASGQHGVYSMARRAKVAVVVHRGPGDLVVVASSDVVDGAYVLDALIEDVDKRVVSALDKTVADDGIKQEELRGV
jgi:hypothetical protein